MTAKYYGNGSIIDVERFLLNEVPGVTAFRIDEYGQGIVRVFVGGGLESDIAEALYQTMTCGIIMEGTITCTVNGSDIKFSRGAAPCKKKWNISRLHKYEGKVRAPGTFEKVPEEEYQKPESPVANPTLRFFSEVCSTSYPEEDVRAPLNVLSQFDEKALSDLAEEMADYKEEPEGLALNPLWRTWYKQWRQTNNSQYKADPLSPGYGQQVPTSTTNGTDPGFPLPTTPAIPGTVIWGDSPLVLSGEALRAWGVALDNADYAAPEIKEDVERLPASPGWAPADAFPPTKPPTTMYVCLSYGCPDRAPSHSREICYTCGKAMTGVLVEETELVPSSPVDPNKITLSFKGIPIEGMMDGEFVTHERTGGVIDVKKDVIAGMDSI